MYFLNLKGKIRLAWVPQKNIKLSISSNLLSSTRKQQLNKGISIIRDNSIYNSFLSIPCFTLINIFKELRTEYNLLAVIVLVLDSEQSRWRTTDIPKWHSMTLTRIQTKTKTKREGERRTFLYFLLAKWKLESWGVWTWFKMKT